MAFAPGFFPALAVAGLFCQLLALFMNGKHLLLSGLIMVVARRDRGQGFVPWRGRDSGCLRNLVLKYR